MWVDVSTVAIAVKTSSSAAPSWKGRVTDHNLACLYVVTVLRLARAYGGGVSEVSGNPL